VSQTIEHYANYYAEDESLAQWRSLGALGKAANIVELCGHNPERTVIDIGCGDGAIIERMASLNEWSRSCVIGVEVSPSAITRLEAKGIRAALFDGSTVPFPDLSFDLAVLSHVIEHVEDPRRLLYEAARVARQVFVEVPMEDHRRMPADYVPDKTGHINFYNPKTIRRLLQTCGLKIQRSLISHMPLEGYRFRYGSRGPRQYWVKESLLKIAPAAATRWFTYHYSAIASRAES